MSATDTLVGALNDRDYDGQVDGDFSSGGFTRNYVRAAAVNALAKVNPKAAAPLALEIIAELRTMKTKSYAGLGIESIDEYVTFSEETITAFRQAVTNID